MYEFSMGFINGQTDVIRFNTLKRALFEFERVQNVYLSGAPRFQNLILLDVRKDGKVYRSVSMWDQVIID